MKKKHYYFSSNNKNLKLLKMATPARVLKTCIGKIKYNILKTKSYG